MARALSVHDDPFDFDIPCETPLEFVEVPHTGEHALSDEVRSQVALYTVHDGGAIPRQFRFKPDGTPIVDPDFLKARYLLERDWGANIIASQLAGTLSLSGYARCRVARVLLDFNRFPGSTPSSVANPLESLAIGGLYAEALKHRQKTELLEQYYDPISDGLEEVLNDKLITLAIHTYDERNPSATRRADVSIVSLPLSYQREARMTFGVFDPLYPDDLAESTCNRILRDRISLDLERAGFRVIHNHPYPMPDGSIELRAQVWFFFQHLRERFYEAYPETIDEEPYLLVWTMLLDTNLRLAEAEELRSFLHRYRKVKPSQAAVFNAALEAYYHIRRFLRDSTVVSDFRRSPDRPSSIGIEVRKDLIGSFDRASGMPKKPTEAQREVGRRITQAMAGAIASFIDKDRGCI